FGVRGVGEVRHQAGGEIVLERRPLLCGERGEIRLYEIPGEIAMFALRSDRGDQPANKARWQLVGERDRKGLIGERRIARTRGGHVVAHPLVRVRGAAAKRQQSVVDGAIPVAAGQASDSLAQGGRKRPWIFHETRKAPLRFRNNCLVAETPEY